MSIAGASQVDESTVADKIATAPTEKFLGLFRGVVYDYSVYDPSLVQRDLARIERFYRGQGLLEAHARVARVSDISPGHVRVDFVVEEGRPTLNRNIKTDGIDGLPAAIVTAVQGAAQAALPQGTRFDENAYKAAQVAVLRALTDRGYAYATLTFEATIDLGAHVVDYEFTVVPGPAAKFGKVTFVGLDPDGAGPKPQEISEGPLRRSINIDPGDVYSTEAIAEATQALLELEAFTSVNVEPQLTQPPPPNPVVDVIVRTEPTKLREVRFGGGGEFDQLKTDLHLLSSWEDHNFLGGLVKLGDKEALFLQANVSPEAEKHDGCGALQDDSTDDIWLDAKTLNVMRIESRNPPATRVRGADLTLTVDYAPVVFDGEEYWLPSHLASRLDFNSSTQNLRYEAFYTDYHKFGADSVIHIDPVQ